MISNAYDYYMSTYGNKVYSRHDSHKKSDLKSTYNKMVSINRSSPLYKIDFTESTQRLAIDIKETAREINNFADELTDASSGGFSSGQRATSSDEDVATAKYIGNILGNDAVDENSFSLDVIQKALPQVNMGNYLPADSRYLNSGSYSFDLNIDNVTYEFQFNVNNGDTSKQIQSKLNRLINNSNVGIKSEVLTNSRNESALKIYSTATGDRGGEPVFSISDINTSHMSGAVDLFGMNRIDQMPENAIFMINGTRYESDSDNFIYNNEYELQIKESGKTSISLAEDTDSLSENLTSLISSYNKAIELSQDDAGKNTGKSRLYFEFTRLAKSYADVLNRNGFQLADDGKINIDSNRLKEVSKEGSIQSTINDLSHFKDSLHAKADSMYSNPMEYVNKKIVAYKNPKNNFPNPYGDSAYAGMLFDGSY